MSYLTRHLTCPVCIDTLCRPRILPQCGHTICYDCVPNVLSKNGSLSCPVCNSISTLGSRGLEGLKVNAIVENLLNELFNVPDESPLPSRRKTQQEVERIKNSLEKLGGVGVANYQKAIHAKVDSTKSAITEDCKKMENVLKKLLDDKKSALLHHFGKECADKMDDFKRFENERANLLETLKFFVDSASDSTTLDRELAKIAEKLSMLERQFDSLDKFTKNQTILNKNKLIPPEVMEKLLKAPVGEALEDVAPSATPSKASSDKTPITSPPNYNFNLKDENRTVRAAQNGDVNYFKGLHDHLLSQNWSSKEIAAFVEKPSFCNKRGAGSGLPYIHLAATNGKLELVQLFVESFGANPGVQASEKRNRVTPMFAAVKAGVKSVVEYLIGMDQKLLFSIGCFGQTALHEAAFNGQLSLVEYFVGAKLVDLEMSDNKHRTAFHMAAIGNQPETLELLAKLGASVFAVTDEGQNALHLACHHNYSTLKAIRKLVECWPDLAYVKNKIGLLPEEVAAACKQSQAAELIKKMMDDHEKSLSG